MELFGTALTAAVRQDQICRLWMLQMLSSGSKVRGDCKLLRVLHQMGAWERLLGNEQDSLIAVVGIDKRVGAST